METVVLHLGFHRSLCSPGKYKRVTPDSISYIYYFSIPASCGSSGYCYANFTESHSKAAIWLPKFKQFLPPVWLRLSQELPLLQRAGTDTQLLNHSLRGAAVTQHFSQNHLEEIDGQ